MPTVRWENPVAIEGVVTDVYADGDVWIAGGWNPEDGPAAWTSADGVSWERAAVENQHPDETFAGPRLGPIVRFGDSLLSFGTFVGAGDGRGVYAWRSADGTSWEAIESSSPLFATGYVVQDTAVGEPALVAVENQFAMYSGRLWTWTEATSWVETTPGAGTRAGPFGSGIVVNAVIWSQDRFVAVGARGDSEGQSVASATSWVSVDGRSWIESASDAALDGMQLSAVAGLTAGGFAALGYVESPDSHGTVVALTSPDGLDWQATEPLDGPATPVSRLHEVPGGLVALGGPGVWSSADGIRWKEAESLAAPPVAAAVMGDDIVVVTAQFDTGSWQVQRGSIVR